MGSVFLVNEHVRARIKRIRLEKRLKLVDAASRSGLAVSSYGCMESGFYKINLDNLFRILGALDADISDVWPVETVVSEAESSPAQQLRAQAFRFNEVVSLSRAVPDSATAARPTDRSTAINAPILLRAR